MMMQEQSIQTSQTESNCPLLGSVFAAYNCSNWTAYCGVGYSLTISAESMLAQAHPTMHCILLV